MMKFITSSPLVKMGDLQVNLKYGWAYQSEVNTISYGKDYFEHYTKIENTDIGKNLNNFRCQITEKYCKNILDMGIGCGSFIKNLKIEKKGFDVNPFGIDWLKNNNLFFDPYLVDKLPFDGITMFDVIEHMENPSEFFAKIQKGSYLITSIPIFDRIEKVQLSKHYKPNEHLYYFTTDGFVKIMEMHDFDLIEISSEETKIGRENIITFVFRK